MHVFLIRACLAHSFKRQTWLKLLNKLWIKLIILKKIMFRIKSNIQIDNGADNEALEYMGPEDVSCVSSNQNRVEVQD